MLKMFMTYARLLRIKGWIKNILVFFPLVFGGKLFDLEAFTKVCGGFICFCLVSSSVYVMNDLRDVHQDRKHPEKRNRPIASGKVGIGTAKVLAALCLMSSILYLGIVIKNTNALQLLLIYFVLNVFYSFGLKNIPIVDICILASGFVIRVFFGGIISEIEVSSWLYLVIVSGSLFMGMGKRRNELKRQRDTRKVFEYYNVSFLDKNMYVCVALANVFYALWAKEHANVGLLWTIPMFWIILMRYSLDIEGDSGEDPTEVIIHDKMLIGMSVVYAIWMISSLYFI